MKHERALESSILERRDLPCLLSCLIALMMRSHCAASDQGLTRLGVRWETLVCTSPRTAPCQCRDSAESALCPAISVWPLLQHADLLFAGAGEAHQFA